MKKVKTLHIAIAGFIAVILASCSSSYEPKTIEAISEEFTSGDLAMDVSLGSSKGELSFFEKDGDINTQYIRLKVKLKMRRDGIKNVNVRDINFTSLLSVATINLVDKDGVEIQDLTIKDEDLLKLKKLLTGDKGDSEDIIFEGEYHNSKDAPKWFNETTNFIINLAGDIIVKANSYSNSEDWNDYLDKLESMVSKALNISNKYKYGNLTFQDIVEMEELEYQWNESQKMNYKFRISLNEMSRAQLSRYSELARQMFEIKEKLERL